MDPDATLALIAQLDAEAYDYEGSSPSERYEAGQEVEYLRHDLQVWHDRGGFEPSTGWPGWVTEHTYTGGWSLPNGDEFGTDGTC